MNIDIDSCKCISKSEYHKNLSDQLRNIERNAITLIVTLIASGLPFFVSLVVEHKVVYPAAVVSFSLFIIFSGIIYLTSLSYSYRQLMLVLCSLENALGLDIHTPDWRFKKNSNLGFYPENLKAQVIILILLYFCIFILYLYFNFVIKWNESPCHFCFILLQIVIYLFAQNHLICKYNEKLEKRNEEIRSKIQ